MSEEPIDASVTATAARDPRESLLILSDVHLGSDLHAQAQHEGRGRRSRRIDEDLVKLIGHYRAEKPTGDRWRLVIAGDFIDFIGMAIPTGPENLEGEELDTEPSEEEVEHGLGNASDHARVKLRKVAQRHPEIFDALAAFLLDGHAITIVHGNHDVEFHWDAVKVEFRRLLSVAAKRLSPAHDGKGLTELVEFNPWFFYVDGVAYIEHGHQYDPFCATDTLMAPLSPADPRRIARGFSDVLLRYVVRPTRGLREWGHENTGIPDYIRFGLKLGLGGAFRLFIRFVRGVLELFRLRRSYFNETANALKAEHERRVQLLAEATRIGMDRLRALAALQTPPITRSIRGILASVLLDRIALGMVALLSLAVVGFLGMRHGFVWWGALCIVVAWAALHRHLTRSRHVDPAEELIDRASKLAHLFPAAFVVMGHTHTPVRLPVNEGRATYINLGSWAEEEEEPGEAHAYAAARTHLVIHPNEAGPVAEFLRWDSTTSGPLTFTSETPPPAVRFVDAKKDA